MRIYCFPSNSRQLQMSECRCRACHVKWANPLADRSAWSEVLAPLRCQLSPSFHECGVPFPFERTVAPCRFRRGLHLLDSFAADDCGGDACNAKGVMNGRLVVMASEQCSLASCAIIPGKQRRQEPSWPRCPRYVLRQSAIPSLQNCRCAGRRN